MPHNSTKGRLGEKYAVWDGRFQPLHTGHVGFLKSIIYTLSLPIVIMIIDSFSDRVGASAEIESAHDLARNPLTFWERKCLWELALAEEGLLDTVNVVGIPRPDLYWDIARRFYPSERVICVSDKDDYERSKVLFWAGLGERTTVIPSGGEGSVSATEFKELIKNELDWQRLMPTACLEYFGAIEGPRRFKEASL